MTLDFAGVQFLITRFARAISRSLEVVQLVFIYIPLYKRGDIGFLSIPLMVQSDPAVRPIYNSYNTLSNANNA
jgi:hypothetical protein